MKKTILNILAFFFLSIALTFFPGCDKDEAVMELKRDNVLYDPQTTIHDELGDISQDDGQGNGNRTDSGAEAEPLTVTVFVCGAVDQPGVYLLEGEARVVDAINAAGGMNDEADRDYINQAMLLNDGMKVYIPTKEETAGLDTGISDGNMGMCTDPVKAADKGGKVNINTADAGELMTLPGIGEAKAALIIEYRTNTGKFGCIEDIMKISGIKKGMFDRIKDRICI